MSRRIMYVFAAWLLIAAIANPAAVLAADASAQQKYDELVEKGVFAGFTDGQARLDQKATRSQAAKIVSLILGLEENPEGAKNYRDVPESDWAAGYIGAVTQAHIMEGYGGGIFDPTADVTIEQLAKIMVEALNIEVDPSATVEGSSEWAGGYVQAAIQAGLIPQQKDYTASASRELLVLASYSAYQMVEEDRWISYGKPTGVRKVSIGLHGKFDPDATAVAIEQIGEDEARTTVDIESLAWSDDGGVINVLLSDDAEAGRYEAKLTVEQDGAAKVFAWSYTVEPERVTRIELGGSDQLPRADNVEVPFSLYNQYDEPMTETPEDAEISVASAVNAELHPDRQAVLVDLADWQADRIDIALAVNEWFTTRTYQVADEPVVQSVETGGFVDESGAPVSSLKTGASAYLLLRPYDQYGNLVTDLAWLNANLKAEESASGSLTEKELVQGPGGAAAVRVTAGSYLVNTSITVTVRSLSGDVLAQASIAAESDPSLYERLTPSPVQRATIAVDPNRIVTVGDPADVVDVTTYVTVTSSNVTTLYYAAVPNYVAEIPTADDLLNGWTPSGPVRSGNVPTNGEARLEIELLPEQQYILYVVGTNGTSVSDVAAVNIDTNDSELFHITAVVDATDYTDPVGDQWTVCVFHTPINAAGTVYYIITDNPIYDYSEDDLVRYATEPDVPDDLPVGLVSRGMKSWNGSNDSILVDGRLPGAYHVYVVLEYRGIRLMAEDILADPNI